MKPFTRAFAPALMAGAVLLGCSQGEGSTDESVVADSGETGQAESGWALQSEGEATSLALGPSAEPILRLSCNSSETRLTVNVPAFRPVASEDRLSFGSEGEAIALVADPAGDSQRGGVSGETATPGSIETLLSGPVTVSYGAQSSGPHQTPPEDLVAQFAEICMAKASTPMTGAAQTAPDISACLQQDGQEIAADRLKAIGTEPFWAAEIEGRCVTYSTPEDQTGTRVWTHRDGIARRGIWSGQLDGRDFRLRTRPQARCSDGMSDKSYPIAVTLTVRGEQRSGCAEPI